jgi:hypothetical protein
MKKNNCYIYTNDSLGLSLRTAQETVELFGEDYLEEYGHYLPPDVIANYVYLRDSINSLQKLMKAALAEKYKGE